MHPRVFSWFLSSPWSLQFPSNPALNPSVVAVLMRAENFLVGLLGSWLDFPTGWPGVSRPECAKWLVLKFMCCCARKIPRNINIFVRVPGHDGSGTRSGGSVTGVTEKLFRRFRMFLCLSVVFVIRRPAAGHPACGIHRF